MNESTNKTAIVTGVTGQMGSYIADFLLERDIKVVGAVRRLSVPNDKNIAHIHSPLFSIAPMDLGDSHSISSLIQAIKPDYFFNCAANSFVGSSWTYPEQHMEYNALGVLRQLEAIRKFSPTTRYINFGSSEEWGDVLYSPQDERHPPRARSPYGASKIAARQLVKVYRESYGLYAIQCWCLNYESERRGQEFVTRKITKGVARIAKAIQDGKSFEPLELGALDVCRDWSHASDFVDGVWRMLNQERYNPNFPVGACADMELSRKRAAAALNEYVLSSGETHTVREFVEKAFTVAGISGLWGSKPNDPKDEVYVNHFCVDETTRLGAFRTLVRINPAFYRPADVETLTGDSTRARTELGWRPKVTFDELVRRMVENDLKEARVTT